MELPDSEKAFLQRRRRLVRSWRYVGPGLVCLIVALSGWLFVQHPLLANPAYVVAGLHRGSIDKSMIELMAVLLPIVTCLLLFLCLAAVLICFASFSNERKYLGILAREAMNPGQSPGNPPQAQR